MLSEAQTPPSMRRTTVDKLAGLGIHVPASLPAIDIATGAELSNKLLGPRLLVLHALASLGFDYAARRESVDRWIRGFALEEHLTRGEAQFVAGSSDVPATRFQWYCDSCFALCWVAGLVELDIVTTPEPEDMVFRLPKIAGMEDPWPLVERLRCRKQWEVLQAFDTLFCLHWAINQARLSRSSIQIPLEAGAIVERRHALQWAVSTEPWDEVSLDT